MDERQSQIYKWLVKRGSLTLFSVKDKIHLLIEKENNQSCLLNERDTEEIIEIMTALAGDIWGNSEFVKEPYDGQLFTTDSETGIACWNLGQSQLYVGLNMGEASVEINSEGDPAIVLPVNQAVEMIQVMTQHYNQI